MNVSQILDAAARRIESEGWWSGSGPMRGYCAMMAIGSVTCGVPISIVDGAVNILRNAVGGELGAVVAWNDSSTAAEVIAMLRAVAMTERARESRMLPVVYREPSHA